MNFGFSDEQEALRALAVQVLDDHGPMGSPPEPFDRSLWKAMVVSGLVGAPLAAPAGADLGLIGLGIVAEELGRRAALQPFGATVGAVLVLERLGAPAAAGLARRVADGGTVATFALEEAVGFDARRPATRARRDGTAWRLSGEKVAVPYAESADVLLVGAISDGGPVLAVVDRAALGVGVRSALGTDDEPSGSVDLEEVAVADDHVFGGPALAVTTDMATAVWCATAVGLLDGGLRITSDYIAGREQFGRPIATFQGPAMRIADAYIDSQAVGMATWSALWRLAGGHPAEQAVAIAKFWVADGGQRAVHAFQHLHGGMGVDTSYPIHRYFAQAKAAEVRLGGASAQLERLGAALAASDGGAD